MNNIVPNVTTAAKYMKNMTTVSKRVLSNVANQTITKEEGPIATTIRRKLINSNLQPLVLEIVNESHMHNVPTNSETHFKLFIVSAAFDNLNLLSRHRIVHNILHSELDKAHGGSVHALSMICKTPQQWDTLLLEKHEHHDDPSDISSISSIIRQVMGVSPNCRGGDGSLPKKH